MQPIQEVNENLSEAVSKEKNLKDASTNTIGGIVRYGTRTDSYIHDPNLFVNSSQNAHLPTPISPFSCPNFQGNIIFQSATPTAPPLPAQSKVDACIENETINIPDPFSCYLQPPWNIEENIDRRQMLRRSPVAYDIKILSNEGPEVSKTNQFSRGSTKSHSSSNISYLPYQTLFDKYI